MRLRSIRCAGLAAVALAALGSSGHAQPPAPAAEDAEAGAALTVYLMTMGPGAAVWERFGHNAIWIHDAAQGTDVAYNYGLFDFRQEHFLLHFAQGHLRYWMDGMDAERSAMFYMRQDRSLWVQELNLTAAQRAELQRFLEWNRQEQHKFYDYNYYWDNCSTRVRDALDRVLGGAIKMQTESVLTSNTYRSHTRRLLQVDIPAYVGIMLGLGQRVDRPIAVWEAGFLPVQLQESLRNITVNEGGESSPLVLRERTLFESKALPEPTALPRFWPGFALLGLGLGGVLALLGWRGTKGKLARGGFFTIAILWSGLTGIAGIMLAFLWWFTDHATSAANENLFHANPVSLLLAVALVAGALGARRPRSAVRWLAVGVAGLSLVGVVLKVLPAMYQVNGDVIALLLPVHMGLALGAWHALGGGSAPPAGSAG